MGALLAQDKCGRENSYEEDMISVGLSAFYRDFVIEQWFRLLPTCDYCKFIRVRKFVSSCMWIAIHVCVPEVSSDFRRASGFLAYGSAGPDRCLNSSSAFCPCT